MKKVMMFFFLNSILALSALVWGTDLKIIEKAIVSISGVLIVILYFLEFKREVM